MFGIHDLWLFLVSGIVFNIAPGPDMFCVVSRSASHGVRGGMLAALGVSTGLFVHIAAAAIGLSAILAASATAFTVVKLAGAAYLVYTGLRMIFARAAHSAQSGPGACPARTKATPRAIYVQGLFTNALNPKVALFFLAFLPQFVDPASTQKPLAFMTLGLLLDLTGTIWFLALAWITARAATGFGSRTPALGNILTRAAGGLFVLLGLRLALTGND